MRACSVLFVLFFALCVFGVRAEEEKEDVAVEHNTDHAEMSFGLEGDDDELKDEESLFAKLFKKKVKKCGNVGDLCYNSNNHLGCCDTLQCINGRCLQCFSAGEDCSENSECCLDRCSPDGVCCISDLYDDCISTADCCRGFCDFATNKCVEKACLEVGSPCFEDEECCNHECSDNGYCCVSEHIGDQCRTTVDCCHGFCDRPSGRCVQKCRENGVFCEDNEECCTQNCGDGQTCEDLCVTTGDSCESGADCCTGMCNIDICCAQELFGECEEDAECNTATCVNGICQFADRSSCPFGIGVSCEETSDCDLLICVNNMCLQLR